VEVLRQCGRASEQLRERLRRVIGLEDTAHDQERARALVRDRKVREREGEIDFSNPATLEKQLTHEHSSILRRNCSDL
jgi:hypothetical protein